MAEKSKITSAQSLGSLIKSCRDIMRKDKGLSTDIDRLPILTWLMFLKFLDDLEPLREAEAKMAGKRFHPSIDPPYRWRDWAARADGITGDALISFINNDEATRPDGSRGPGLFAYLRSLRSLDGDRRDVIGAVFQGTSNRMLSGYLLRDVINKINSINFTSTEEIYTLGHLYESMLKEMRDAAGENGEFYTPRPVVQFMVNAINPRLGEKILDPACGTGGFLASAFEHLKKQCKTAEDQHRLQHESLFGIEAKPLPYLLCQMNLLLHGLEYPNIDPLNALRFPLREIGEKDRVDIILTNPPFGGEEEKGIQGNFPEDKRTAETALLFLQLIMRKLRRQAKTGFPPARAAVVVPNGTLFGDGVCARIKEQLLKDFNLHTIVRLPNGVFSPYTGIPTNIMFFDMLGPTRDIWYYEQPKRADGANYTKSKPMKSEEFDACIAWFNDRQENDLAWKVPVGEILASGCNLDRRNPKSLQYLEPMPPEESIANILAKEQRIIEGLQNVRLHLKVDETVPSNPEWNQVRLGDILTYLDEQVVLDDNKEYLTITVKRRHGGLEIREKLFGHEIKTKKQFRLNSGSFIISRIQCWHQAYAIVDNVPEGAIASTNYDQFAISPQVNPRFFWWLSYTPEFTETVRSSASGVVIEKMVFDRDAWLDKTIAIPPFDEQCRLVTKIEEFEQLKRLQVETAAELDALMPSILNRAFKGQL